MTVVVCDTSVWSYLALIEQMSLQSNLQSHVTRAT